MIQRRVSYARIYSLVLFGARARLNVSGSLWPRLWDLRLGVPQSSIDLSHILSKSVTSRLNPSQSCPSSVTVVMQLSESFRVWIELWNGTGSRETADSLGHGSVTPDTVRNRFTPPDAARAPPAARGARSSRLLGAPI